MAVGMLDKPVDWRAQLQREGDGKIEIVVHRAVEVALWAQAIELSHAGFFQQLLAAGPVGDQLRRLAVANAHSPDFWAGIDDRSCIACGKGFSRTARPRDIVVAHAPVQTMLPSAAVVGGVCAECSERHDTAQLRAYFSAKLREFGWPDLVAVDPDPQHAERVLN
jgi:hypothetical protein